MTLGKNICEKLYEEVKATLQQALAKRGMTYRGAETAIWKMLDPCTEKTYFQLIVEEHTGLHFSATFNNMYLWRKFNEVQSKKSVNFQEEYLQFFVQFLGYPNPQAYLNQFTVDLGVFFGIDKNSSIAVVQPIFDANGKNGINQGKSPRHNEQTVDSGDTEALLEIIHLFHETRYHLPKRFYDQALVSKVGEEFQLQEQHLQQVDCLFSIGFYSNDFFCWAYRQELSAWIEYLETPVKFRVKYFNESLQRYCWSDYYESSEQFDCGFLVKMPLLIGEKWVHCYFLCGIENKATRAVTNYLCQHWQKLAEKYDTHTNTAVQNNAFLMVCKVNKDDLQEIYCQNLIVFPNLSKNS